jgi:hypothetical protein
MTKSKPRREVLLESKVRQQKKTIQKLKKTLSKILTVAEKARHEEYGSRMLNGIENIRWIAKETIEVAE